MAQEEHIYVTQAQADWNEANNASPSFIKNKPSITPVYKEVTYSEAATLISNNELVAGALYHITDADDTISTFDVASSVFIEAVSDNEFAEFGSVRMFTPKYDKSLSGYKVWSINETYTTGDIAFWGGKAWANNNGNTGDKVDDFNLDSEWTLINIGDPDWEDYYNVNLYMCGYDFASNKVLWVDSGNGSKVYSNGVSMGLGNPIKYYQWGNDGDLAYYSGISGVVNNSFINCINNRGVIITLSLDSSGITTLSLDSSGITTLSLDNGSSIASLSLDSSNIYSLSLDNSSNIGTLSLDNSSSITTLSLDNGSSIASLSLDKSYIGEIITSISTEYKAKINIYGITGSVDIDFTLYPKLLEDGVYANILQNTLGDIVVFYKDADGGMSASEYIAPVEDEDYVQKKYVEEVIIIAVIVGSTPPIATGDVEYEIPIKGNYDILDYSISAEDAPIGGITTIDLKKNGSLITTTGVNIASGSNDSTGTPTFSDNDVSNSKIRFTLTAIASYAGSKYTGFIRLIKK